MTKENIGTWPVHSRSLTSLHKIRRALLAWHKATVSSECDVITPSPPLLSLSLSLLFSLSHLLSPWRFGDEQLSAASGQQHGLWKNPVWMGKDDMHVNDLSYTLKCFFFSKGYLTNCCIVCFLWKSKLVRVLWTSKNCKRKKRRG